MKKLITNLKPIVYLLTLIILLQGCAIYHPIGVTLDQAVHEGKKVKLVTNQDKVIKFKRIESENEMYYGFTKVKKELVRIPINAEQVKTIKPKNNVGSVLVSISLIFVSVVILGIIVGAVQGGVYPSK